MIKKLYIKVIYCKKIFKTGDYPVFLHSLDDF